MALERALSKLGAASRAEAQRLVRAGRVTVDGTVVTNPLTAVVPERSSIAIDGVPARRAGWRTIVFHKPRGVVTTRRDPEGRPTVFDVLGGAAQGLVAVGRLDLASSGVLLLTSDTRLADWLTDPANGVVRRYAVTVRGAVSDEGRQQLETGIDDLHARRVAIRKRSRRETHLIVELDEGKNREVRRLFAAIGHEVTRLTRVAFGPVELGSLQPGEFRELTREELRRGFGLGL